MLRGKPIVAVLAVALSLGVGVWRLVRALSGGSSTTFYIPTAVADPSCATSINFYAPRCNDNPCNPTSAYYKARDLACQSFSPPGVPTFPVTESSTGSKSKRSRQRPPNTPPPPGPIPAGKLSKSVDQQLVKFARVQPSSLDCPSLARHKGATATCRVSGTALDSGRAHAHGTAQVTVLNHTGQVVGITYRFTGPGGLLIRGTGYPFDPDTGRVL